MSRLWDQGNTLGYILGAVIIAVAGWVFTINADVRVLQNSHETHKSRPAHQNTRQEQITELKGRVDAHENLVVHPPAQLILTDIQTKQAAHTAELQTVQKQLDRILDALQNGPRPR